MKKKRSNQKILSLQFSGKNRRGLNKFLKKNRRALSAVIITLIMIALALVLVAVVWVVVSNLIKGQTEGISLEKLTFDAEIKEVGIDNSTNNLTLTIQRKAGQGEITGMKFVFENSTDKEIETLSFTLIELGKKRFEFHLDIPVDSIRKISIVPLFQSSGGEETIGNVVDTYKFKGGESGAYVPVVPCYGNCTGKECGNDGCDGSCGTCSSGFTCNASGMCASSNVTSCTPTTCAALGYECGTAANGTCSGTLSCGNCSSGYSCISGSCVEVLSGTTNNISQWGITWYFDDYYEYGTFINGDYWVIGPVTIIDITPGWDGEKHGSVVNPTAEGLNQGYDGRESYYDPSLRSSVPIELNANDSLVSTVGLEVTGRSYLETAAVLTCLGSIPPIDAFRPSYMEGAKKIFRLSDVDQSILPSVTPVSSTPDFSEFIGKTQKVWLDHMEIPYSQHIHPTLNMEVYGQDVGEVVGDVALLLMIDDPDREQLLINYLQIGIDLYGTALLNDDLWWGGGGQSSGRKWPILFTGIMFEDSDILNLISDKSGDYLYSNGYNAENPPSDYLDFGEDDQTFYVSSDDIWGPPYEINCHGGDLYKDEGLVSVTHGSNIVYGTGTNFLESDIMTGTMDGVAVRTKFAVNGTISLTDPSEDWNNWTSKAYEIDSIDETNQILYLTRAYRGTTQTNMHYKIGTGTTSIGWLWYGHGYSPGTYQKDYKEYTINHLGLPEWGNTHTEYSMQDGYDWVYSSYRRCCTAYVWAGTALTSLIMQENSNAKNLWNHDAFFDYTDRYLRIELEGIDDEGNIFDSTPPSGLRQASDFAAEMWDTYRSDYGCIYSDLNSATHTRIYNCAGVSVDCNTISSCGNYPNQRAINYDPCGVC